MTSILRMAQCLSMITEQIKVLFKMEAQWYESSLQEAGVSICAGGGPVVQYVYWPAAVVYFAE